jgi:hypothetical protein
MCKNLIWLLFLLTLAMLNSSEGQAQQMSLQNLRKYITDKSIISVMAKLNFKPTWIKAKSQ